MKVGFADHHLNNYHADTFLRILRESHLADVEVVTAWESNPATTDWCDKNQVKRADSIGGLVKQVDAIVLLAPDNIEHHLPLAREILSSGKPTFIDKFLAPTTADAREIVTLAQRGGAPIFSSSALRFASELEDALPRIDTPAGSAYARGLGQWAGYGIHSIGMLQRMMGFGVRRLCDSGTPADRFVTLDYGGGRRALLEVRESGTLETFTWHFGAAGVGGLVAGSVREYERFYRNLMARVVEFFRTGEPEMGVDEALEAISILNAASRSQNADGAWVTLDD